MIRAFAYVHATGVRFFLRLLEITGDGVHGVDNCNCLQACEDCTNAPTQDGRGVKWSR